MNKIILAIILAGFGAQCTKLIIYWFKHKHLSWHDLFVTGGMPSSHAAFVTSLATIIYLEEGNSTVFAVALIIALIVLRDAYGIRRTVGKEGEAIKRLFKLHNIQSKEHYALGHKPSEVLVGILIGLAVAAAVYLF
ncbi:MAG TPA: divergent PAP2 family protein [Candidatus Nanoarchaeia archaeon]|nr:divergent PAP2 family protein [Candidatus Nanoarchaeia archaeon]